MFNWLAFLTYAVITTATPGPNNIMSLSNASRVGFWRALPFNAGIWSAFSVLMLLCTFFCQALSALIPKIQLPMMLIGAAYMLYLAWITWNMTGVKEGNATPCSFWTGFFLQFVNAKIYIYCIVAMQVYILPHYAGNTLALVFFALLLACIGAGFTVMWAAFGSIFKKLFAQYGRLINGIMALLLVYCAVSLFF